VKALTVKLTQGYEAQISPEDIALLGHLWCVSHPETGRPYAVRRKEGKIVYMHREVCQPRPLPSEDVDHINGDTLDNRRENLRPVTRSLNNLNRRSVKGVYYHKRHKLWQAYISINRKRTHLGWHKTEEAAREARLAAEKELGL